MFRGCRGVKGVKFSDSDTVRDTSGHTRPRTMETEVEDDVKRDKRHPENDSKSVKNHTIKTDERGTRTGPWKYRLRNEESSKINVRSKSL